MMINDGVGPDLTAISKCDSEFVTHCVRVSGT